MTEKIKETPKLIIEVAGGLVERILANAEIDVELIDYDNLKTCEEGLAQLPEIEARLTKLEEDPLWRELPY